MRRTLPFAVLALVAPPAAAHEPLWGETPQTFAFGVVHPELRLSRGQTLLSVQYASRPDRNFKIEAPFGRDGQVQEVMLGVKSRLHVRLGPDFKQMGALLLGVHTRQPGGQIGYAFAHERLTDTIWVSALRTQTREGGATEIDAAYGYWVKRARTPADLGVVVALGGHHESLPEGRRAGVHGALIVTRGQRQARIGALLPRHGRAQVRLGIEALL